MGEYGGGTLLIEVAICGLFIGKITSTSDVMIEDQIKSSN